MKKFYESKAVWLGVVTLVLSILTFLQGEEWVKEYPKIVAGIGTLVGILGIVIRYFTSTTMELTNKIKYSKLRKNKKNPLPG